MGRERFVERELSKVGGTLHRLLDAGLRVVLGSDSGNWPVFPYLLHGISTLREVDLLAKQGFTPTQVLTAATITPARMLHIDDRVGTVEVGKEADLVVLRDDPTQDLHAVWTIEYTVANGEIRDPAGWIRGPAMAHPSAAPDARRPAP
jgi:imidazolonepropionase-like amidohydrolase